MCTKAKGTGYFMPLNTKTMGVCVTSCPTETDMTKYNCIGGVSPSAAAVQSGYCLPQLATKKIMNRCLVYDPALLSIYNLTESYKAFSPSYISEVRPPLPTHHGPRGPSINHRNNNGHQRPDPD